MQFTYLWFLQEIYEWVFEKILDPVFDWLKGLLSDLFTWVYSSILYPVLEQTAFKFASWVWTVILDAFSWFFYFIYSQILYLIDALYDVFDTLSGLANVTFDGKKMPLLEALFGMDSVNRLFWMVNFMGLCLAFLLAIFAVGKSAMDLDFENRRPVSRVLASIFKCFMQLFTVQILVMFVVRLSQLMLKAINTAVMSMHGTEGASLGSILFAVTSMNASTENAAYNLPASTANLTSGMRGEFYAGNLSYADIDTVKKYFDLSKIDYVIGLLMSIFLFILLFSCLLVFCQRIFDMLTLYIVSPLFVATIPLDDGEKFKKWRELFLGKTFSGFGLLFAMKFYIMLCPLIMDSRLSFTESPEFDYLTKLVFLVGGCLAVIKSGSMVTGILSIAAARSEEQMAAAGTKIGMRTLEVAGTTGVRAAKVASKYVGKSADAFGSSMQGGGSGGTGYDSFKKAVSSMFQGGGMGSSGGRTGTRGVGGSSFTGMGGLSGGGISGQGGSQTFGGSAPSTDKEQNSFPDVMIEMQDLSGNSEKNGSPEENGALSGRRRSSTVPNRKAGSRPGIDGNRNPGETRKRSMSFTGTGTDGSSLFSEDSRNSYGTGSGSSGAGSFSNGSSVWEDNGYQDTGFSINDVSFDEDDEIRESTYGDPGENAQDRAENPGDRDQSGAQSFGDSSRDQGRKGDPGDSSQDLPPMRGRSNAVWKRSSQIRDAKNSSNKSDL